MKSKKCENDAVIGLFLATNRSLNAVNVSVRLYYFSKPTQSQSV